MKFIKYSFVSGILASSLLMNIPQAQAFNDSNVYVDNHTGQTLFAQFLFGDHHECSDDMNASIHKVAPYSTISDSYHSKNNGVASCDFIVNVFKLIPPSTIQQDPTKPKKPIPYTVIMTEHGTWKNYSGDTYKLDSHDTPPRVCASGYGCTTDRADGGNHLHLEINEGKNTYSHIKYINISPADRYVNYDRIKGSCVDSVDDDYFKVPKTAAISDEIDNSDKGSHCIYNVNISKTKDGKDKVCQVQVEVSNDHLNRTYISDYAIEKNSDVCKVSKSVVSSDNKTYDIEITSN
ncbi:MAG: hypothetical protein RLZZ293_1106 [Pseudomonadota bacterium]|jgi:hypothetical protein